MAQLTSAIWSKHIQNNPRWSDMVFLFETRNPVLVVDNVPKPLKNVSQIKLASNSLKREGNRHFATVNAGGVFGFVDISTIQNPFPAAPVKIPTIHEKRAVEGINAFIKSIGKPINVVILDSKGNEVYCFEEIQSAKQVTGFQKTDITLLNSNNQPVVFISHKKAEESSFQQYGGISESKAGMFTYNHPETQKFLRAISMNVESNRLKYPMFMHIKDKRLVQIAVFGKDFGKAFSTENTHLVAYGQPKFRAVPNRENTYILEWSTGQLLNIENNLLFAANNKNKMPVFAATYRADRTFDYQGTRYRGARVGIYPYAFMKGRSGLLEVRSNSPIKIYKPGTNSLAKDTVQENLKQEKIRYGIPPNKEKEIQQFLKRYAKELNTREARLNSTKLVNKITTEKQLENFLYCESEYDLLGYLREDLKVFVKTSHLPFDKRNEIICYHTCDYWDFMKMIRMQNTPTIISASTHQFIFGLGIKNTSADTYIKSMQKVGNSEGVNLKLSGNAVIYGFFDIWSEPDENGNRWMELKTYLLRNRNIITDQFKTTVRNYGRFLLDDFYKHTIIPLWKEITSHKQFPTYDGINHMVAEMWDPKTFKNATKNGFVEVNARLIGDHKEQHPQYYKAVSTNQFSNFSDIKDVARFVVHVQQFVQNRLMVRTKHPFSPYFAANQKRWIKMLEDGWLDSFSRGMTSIFGNQFQHLVLSTIKKLTPKKFNIKSYDEVLINYFRILDVVYIIRPWTKSLLKPYFYKVAEPFNPIIIDGIEPKKNTQEVLKRLDEYADNRDWYKNLPAFKHK